MARTTSSLVPEASEAQVPVAPTCRVTEGHTALLPEEAHMACQAGEHMVPAAYLEARSHRAPLSAPRGLCARPGAAGTGP